MGFGRRRTNFAKVVCRGILHLGGDRLLFQVGKGYPIEGSEEGDGGSCNIGAYGEPRYIIMDNGKQFSNRLMDELCENFKFKQHKSLMYHAPANGLGETFNKTLCNLLKKVVGRTKRDWHERVSEAL